MNFYHLNRKLMPQSLIFILFFESLFQFVYYLNFSSVG